MTSESSPAEIAKHRYFIEPANEMRVDRTGKLKGYVQLAPQCPMPAWDSNFKSSFESIAENRARELLSHNKRIRVFWSGGVDSTLVLLLLGSMAQSPDQVEVVGTYGSIIESGYVFDRFLKSKFKCQISLTTHQVQIEPDCIYTTGMFADFLFGIARAEPKRGPRYILPLNLGTHENQNEPFEKVVPEEILLFLEPSLRATPRPLKTVAELRWFIAFNFHWINEHYKILKTFYSSASPQLNLLDVLNNQVLHFFESEDFQKWSIQYAELRGTGQRELDYLNHKPQLRALLKHFGLATFAERKRKCLSYPSAHMHSSNDWALFLGDGSFRKIQDLNSTWVRR